MALAQGFAMATNIGIIARAPRFMWPWEAVPASVAHGILDDETCDRVEIVRSMRLTGGDSLVVDEDALIRAHELACSQTSIRVSATGTAGLAGLLAAPFKGQAAVIFSGVER